MKTKISELTGKSSFRIGVLAVFLLLIVTFPLFIKNQYILRLGTLCLMYASLAMSLNLMSGFMGQSSLGHTAFMGIGAYTSTLLSEYFELPFLVTLLCAIIMSGLFGLLMGIPALRLSGSHLAIVTMGFCEVARLVELNWVSLTRGPMGITGIARPVIFGYTVKSNSAYYYLCLILLIITYFLLSNLITSPFGRSLLAIREDAIAAEAMGVNLIKYKVLAFSVSAAIAGMMGSFYAHYMRYIDPSAFTFDHSTQIISMVILGGSGSLPGSLIGAIIMTIIPEALRDFSYARMMVYGLVLSLVIIFRPGGICGTKNLAQLLKIEKKYAKDNTTAIGLSKEHSFIVK